MYKQMVDASVKYVVGSFHFNSLDWSLLVKHYVIQKYTQHFVFMFHTNYIYLWDIIQYNICLFL